MFERETKREKILEARQREIRLKERSRSEQSKEEEAGREEGEEDPELLIARAESDFYNLVEMELRRREKREDAQRVRTRERRGVPSTYDTGLLRSCCTGVVNA